MSARDLLSWYDQHSRDLPWRENQDPYRIWISEIMLQQTRVETVIPYYQRFLDRFPDVETLARAPLDEVLSLWSGLGYYRRARQLHGAAGQVKDLGKFPDSSSELQKLPGIGPYTAAAIASIAFGEVIPVMDGNVERVMARRIASLEDPKKSTGRKLFLESAAALLDPERPGDSNQALMELGATVCIPRNPRCKACPISASCKALEKDGVENYPVPKVKKAPELIRRRVALVKDGERVLLFRRPDDSDLLAGTWELPWVESDGKTVRESEEDLSARYGGVWILGPRTARVRHSITFRSLRLDVHRSRIEGGSFVAEGPEAGWFETGEVEALPTSSQVAKVMAAAGPDVPEQTALW